MSVGIMSATSMNEGEDGRESLDMLQGARRSALRVSDS